MSTMSACALNWVRSARLARHANQSDVTTAPTVPAAAIAAMVCWCAFDNSSIALKNSSIIRSTHHQHQHRMQLAEQAARATSTPKAFVWIWLLHMAWRVNNSTFTISNEQLRTFGVHRNSKYQVLRELERAG